MDTIFPHFYEFEWLTEIPGKLPHYYYPGASRQGGQDGLLVKILTEEGRIWLGTFSFGKVTAKGISGVYTTPDPYRFCVVSRGEGYLVHANDPSIWEPVLVTPITDVRLIPAREMIIFANFTSLIGYGLTGIKWHTRRLAWDGLKITHVTEDLVNGEYWDIRTESMVDFTVDLATGVNHGGIEEP